ncbi:MAG: DEAD/DEAH box helicase family protein, partial [Ghiorsea sp.]|nr:DEAD/DEAH box helicase family protein [Ghiorsea sp.]
MLELENPRIYIRATVFAPLWQSFDYAWPDDLGEPKTGIRVVVPFGHSKRVAVVEQVFEQAVDQVATVDLKQVLDRLDDKSLYADVYWCWLQRASSYYLCTTGEMYELALAWAALDKQRRFKCLDRALLLDFDNDLLLAFTSKRLISLATIGKHCEVHALQWRVLQAVRAGVLEEVWEQPQDDATCVKTRLQLRSSQQQAVDALCEHQEFYPALLFGRTGSGKTEVYLQAAEKLVAQGKQVLILVPEIGLTPMWKQRLSERFKYVSIWHSG